jgi:hypothetical protein
MLDGFPICNWYLDTIIEFENILKLWPEGYIIEDPYGEVTEEDIVYISWNIGYVQQGLY